LQARMCGNTIARSLDYIRALCNLWSRVLESIFWSRFYWVNFCSLVFLKCLKWKMNNING